MNKLILRRVLISVIGAVGVIAIGLAIQNTLANREIPVRRMSFRESAKSVQVASIEYKSREIAISNMARVISESAIDLISEVQGEMQRGSVPIKRGQSFSRGQILFKVDDREARLSLFAQKSNFMTAIASILPELRLDYPDAYPAWQAYFESLNVEKPLPALPKINNSQEKVFFSTRNITNQFYTIKSAEERLSKYIVRAPFNGSFIEVLQEEGGVVNGGTRIARIARSRQLELEMPMRTSDLEFIRQGMAVKIYAENEEAELDGRITRISSTVDPTTQSVNVYVSFNPGQIQVLEGQYMRVDIPGNRIKNVMEIPRNAVFNRNQVFVVNDSNRLEVRDIQIEKFNDESLLFSGIQQGERVVTVPLINAYENMPVKIMNGGTPAATQGDTSTQDVANKTVGSGGTAENSGGGGGAGASRPDTASVQP